MSAADLFYCFLLPPNAAIAYLRGKGYEISWDWEDVWQEAHAKAATVAKVTRLDILQDIYDALDTALAEGKTGAWFEDTLTPVLQRKGWWGVTERKNPHTGKMERVQLGSPWRLATIFRTNLQTAYMAGHYRDQMDNVKYRPYWQYIAVMDDRTRPAHSALHGKVFRSDDPFWETFYPPNGWGCRCRVTTLSQKDAERAGVTVEDSSGNLGESLRLVSQKTGEMRKVATFTTRDPLTGRSLTIAPDVGWSYNPGKAAWKPDTTHYTGAIATLARKELR